MELEIWEPYVRQVCYHHGFGSKRIISGVPGTFPTFIVESDNEAVQPQFGSIVVKFFGPLFDGADSYRIEQSMGYFLAQQSLPVRSPFILASGQLTLEWWYLIFEYIPGVSLGQIRHQLSPDAWKRIALQMGAFIKALHSATATTLPIIASQSSFMIREGFVDFLETQRDNSYPNHLKWNDLPPHLLEQMQDFILPVEELLDPAALPHLIHADLTRDHLLGEMTSDPQKLLTVPRSPPTEVIVWHPLAIIDWGDTRIGNILYELVALYLDLFQGDKNLVRICLEAYGLSDFYCQDFPRKALSMVLLHQFPMPASVYAPHQDAPTLHALAERLYGL